MVRFAATQAARREDPGIGRVFRIYTAATGTVVLLFSGVLTGIQSAKLPDGDPTPLLGLYERIGIGSWLQWMAVLAVMPIRGPGQRAPRGGRAA